MNVTYKDHRCQETKPLYEICAYGLFQYPGSTADKAYMALDINYPNGDIRCLDLGTLSTYKVNKITEVVPLGGALEIWRTL